MRVVHIASEALPYSKTGGLADVAAALPAAQTHMGLEVTLITPWYGPISSIRAAVPHVEDLGVVPVDFPFSGTTARVLACKQGLVRRLFVFAPEYFEREHIYGPPGEEYFDNSERFLFFSRAALAAALAFARPDVLHCHDWQAALIPALVHHNALPVDDGGRVPATVATIHNLAFQGLCGHDQFIRSGLPPQAWTMHEAEFHGRFNLLKAGLFGADAITTVSPNYAREITTSAFGCGLEGFLLTHQAKLRGVINGVDTAIWNPETDAHLNVRFSVRDMAGKDELKRVLLKENGLLPVDETTALAGFVGRLTSQKGADLIAQAIPRLVEAGVSLILLGKGEAKIESRLQEMRSRFPSRVSLTLAYNETLAHRIIAASDLFIMPSRFEPCGLTQLYAMRYGTLPVTSTVGGLLDTVTPHPSPKATGFHLPDISADSLVGTVQEALRVMATPDTCVHMRRLAMQRDASWASSAHDYASLYKDVCTSE